MRLAFLSWHFQNCCRKQTAAAACAALVALAGCRSGFNNPSVPPNASAAAVDLDSRLMRAFELQRPVLVFVTESGHSQADDKVRSLVESSAVKDRKDRLISIVLDIGVSRNRATAARFHITNTPVLLCLSPRGLIVSRDEGPITLPRLSMRIGEVMQNAPALDARFASLEELASRNPSDAQTQFELANFLLAQQNAREAIPHLETVAHNETVDATLRIRAWTALARAHLWVAEPEKARHEAEDLIAVLGLNIADARAGGNLVLGLQDAVNVKRIALARREFEAAIAAAPASVYGKQAAGELAKLPYQP